MLDISVIAAAQQYPIEFGTIPQRPRLEQLLRKDTGATWSELEETIAELKKSPHTHSYLVDIAKEHILTTKEIVSLYQEGWRLIRQERLAIAIGACYREEKQVMVAKGLKDFERDITLFHELTHAYLGIGFRDCTSSQDPREQQNARIKSMIVEWAARQARANPETLRTAVLTFGLKPHIYDAASYQACREYAQQKELPFPNQRPQME